MNKISDRLKLLRGSLSQQNFAESIGLKQTTYGQYERGTTSPNMDTISEICRTLGINPRWLVLGEEPMYDAEASQERPRIKAGAIRNKPLDELPADMQRTVKKVAKGVQAWRQGWDELPDWAKDHMVRLEEELDTAREELLKAKDLAIKTQDVALQMMRTMTTKGTQKFSLSVLEDLQQQGGYKDIPTMLSALSKIFPAHDSEDDEIMELPRFQRRTTPDSLEKLSPKK